jgi:hypothetical protein
MSTADGLCDHFIEIADGVLLTLLSQARMDRPVAAPAYRLVG